MIFGSYARGVQKKSSDIDILIQLTKNRGWAFAGVKLALEKELKRKVDILSYNGIHHALKKEYFRKRYEFYE